MPVQNIPQHQPQGGQVATVKSLFSNAAVKARFDELLKEKAPKFISSVISVANSPSLIGANPQTVLNAAVIAATLDLEINQNLGFAYIVPYNNRNGKEAQFQMGWRGFYQLAMRTNKYKTITTNVVYEGEFKVVNRFKEEYEFNEPTSDKVVGFLAYYMTREGAEKYFYMSVEDMEKHAKKYSQSYRFDKNNSSQWSQNFYEMGKKTVLKLLLSKYAELSTEQIMAQKFDQAVVTSSEPTQDAEFFEAEYVDNQPAEQTIDPTEIAAARKKALEDNAKAFLNEKKETDVPTIDFEEQK